MVPHCLMGLKAARKASQLTVEQVADAMGVNVNSYYRIEKGTRRTYFDKVCKVADLFGCRTDDLRFDPELAAAPPVTEDDRTAAALENWGDQS